MRQSNRGKILEAVVDVVQREGMTSVTLDSVALEAGLTKGGLMYHFPTRDALLLAVHQHLADEWEASMVQVAGKAPQDASTEERLAAYARVAIQRATRAQLLLILEGSTHPDHSKPWGDVLARWTPSAEEATNDPAVLARFIAHLAADGLWMYESLTSERLSPELRRLVAEYIAGAIAPGSADMGPRSRRSRPRRSGPASP